MVLLQSFAVKYDQMQRWLTFYTGCTGAPRLGAPAHNLGAPSSSVHFDLIS